MEIHKRICDYCGAEKNLLPIYGSFTESKDTWQRLNIQKEVMPLCPIPTVDLCSLACVTKFLEKNRK